MRSIRSRAERRSGGFSLLEVIVALAILGIAIASLMQLFSGSLDTIRRSEDHSKALVYARGLMDEAYSKSRPEDISVMSNFGDKFNAEVSAMQVSEEEGVSLYEIRVKVSWPPSGTLELSGNRMFYDEKGEGEIESTDK